jgi:hypothetical protein
MECEGGLSWCLRARSCLHVCACVLAEKANVSRPAAATQWHGVEDGRDLIGVATLECCPRGCLSASGGCNGRSRRRGSER